MFSFCPTNLVLHRKKHTRRHSNTSNLPQPSHTVNLQTFTVESRTQPHTILFLRQPITHTLFTIVCWFTIGSPPERESAIDSPLIYHLEGNHQKERTKKPILRTSNSNPSSAHHRHPSLYLYLVIFLFSDYWFAL